MPNSACIDISQAHCLLGGLLLDTDSAFAFLDPRKHTLVSHFIAGGADIGSGRHRSLHPHDVVRSGKKRRKLIAIERKSPVIPRSGGTAFIAHKLHVHGTATLFVPS